MNILFFGDIVGAAATQAVIDLVPALRREHAVDVVIANAENCAPDGFGTTVRQIDDLAASGVDIITGGNHSWDSPESVASLDHPRMLRPLNMDGDIGGRGVLAIDVGGEPVTVINLADACAMKSAKAVGARFFPAYSAWSQASRHGTVLVDYHGDHVLEKQIFARAVDGEAAAVLGTHTHEATEALHLLPGGTALVTDVGMTGPVGGVQGFAYDGFVRGLREHGDAFALPLPSAIDGEITIGAVLLRVENGKTRCIERIRG